jgi:ATP:ADP antiporter, AAA family
MTTTTNSPLGALLTRIAPIEPRETRAVVAAFSLFFFMWAGYFAVRPVRETVAINFIGRENVADLWLYTALFSILIIPAYGTIVARLRRSVFLPAIYGAVALLFAGVGVAMQTGGMTSLIGKVFYVFISVMNLMLLSMFWSFLLELFDKGQTKRLFGVIAAGGSAGALAGPFISDITVNAIGTSGILYLGAAMFGLAIVCQRVLLGVWTHRSATSAPAEDRPIGGNVFAGITLIARSPYLIGIALFIVGISAVSTLLYFEQLRIVEVTFSDAAARTRAFARIDWLVQTITVISQVFITGRIAMRFGITALLTAVPLLMVLGFLVLASSSGVFAIFVAVIILRRAGEYAFVRPGREMLWSPLDKETKYKAKNTVDVPVYRGADYVIAQGQNAISAAGMSASNIMLVGAGVAGLWALVGWWLGRRFESGAGAQRSSAATAEQPARAGSAEVTPRA